MQPPIVVVLHRDDILVFRSAHAAEAYMEPGYNRREDDAPIYDGEGSLLRWHINDERYLLGLVGGEVFRLEVASRDPQHASVLRADLICHLAHSSIAVVYIDPLFTLPLKELIEVFVMVNGFTA